MLVNRFLSLFAAVLLLAACETGPTSSGSVTGDGSATAGQNAAGDSAAQIQADRVFFDTDRYDLQPQARSTIESWAAWLRNNPSAVVTIEGHADERGTREYNLGLGERRATAAKNYLVALGISANRVNTISYGKERPVDGGHNETAWAKNRRSVLVQG